MVSLFLYEWAVAHWVAVGTKYHPSMARKGSVLVLASAMLTLAACSSDGDATPSTIPGSSADPVAPTTAAPATTLASLTTQAPTTTIDPAVALAAQVEADFREADRLASEALQDPNNAEKEAAALDRRTGALADQLRETLAEFRQSDRAWRPNDLVPASLEVEVPAALVVDGADVAELVSCELNSWVVVEVGAGPDGTDAIVDSSVVAFRNSVLLRDVDGIWLVEGGTTLGRWEGADGCPAE